MLKFKFRVAIFTCAIALAAGTSLAIGEDRASLDAPRAQPITRESCIAAGAVERARCQAQAKVGSKDSDGRCEEATNLQQRMCMLDVLERLHPDASRPR
jgi:hypothetical protein